MGVGGGGKSRDSHVAGALFTLQIGPLSHVIDWPANISVAENCCRGWWDAGRGLVRRLT